MVKNKIKSRRIRRELRKAKSDLAALSQYLKECESMLEDYIVEWSKDLSFILKELKIETNNKILEEKTESNKIQKENYKSFESEKSDEENLDIIEKSDIPDWVKKSFRKIAMKTHPDKVKDSLNADYLVSLYEKANSAVTDKDYESIIDICYNLGIECDLDPEIELKITRDKQEVIKKKLMKIDDSAAWVWCESYGLIDKKLIFLNSLLLAFGIKEVEESKLRSIIEDLENR